MDIVVDHPVDRDVERLKYLWKITFNDTDRYVNMIFDNYFHSEFSLCAVIGNNIVASLTGIPYDFSSPCGIFRGLYLCGLSTVPEYRCRGIMSRMISMIEEECRCNGFLMTFLIPADDDLRRYYFRMGYRDAAMLKRLYAPGNMCDIARTSYTDVSVLDYDGFLKLEETDKLRLLNSCRESEANKHGIVLQHNLRDWELVITDLLSDGGLVIIDDILKVNDVALLSSDGELRVLAGSDESVGSMLEKIFCESGNSVSDSRELLFSCKEEKYGMVKFLAKNIVNFSDEFKTSENRIFEKNDEECRKYGKMRFYEKSGDIRICEDGEILLSASDVHFRLMLD